MKKKWMIPVIILSVILIFTAGVLWCLYDIAHTVPTGRCLVTRNGDYLILLGNEPICMSDLSKNKDLFSGLKTGDEIRILHGPIQETYPGRTGVYFCKRITEGSIANIPEKVIESLCTMGWIPVDDTGLTKEIYTGVVISFTPVHKDQGNYILKINLQSGFDEEITMTVVQTSEIMAIDDIAPGDRVRVVCASESSGYREVKVLTEYQELSYE